jgi:hypothetical protein
MAESKKNQHGDLALPAHMLAILDNRRRGDDSRSSRLAEDLQDYYILLENGLRRARLLLTPAEAATILDAHPRVRGRVTTWTAERLARHIEEACRLDNAGERWAVDCLTMAQKLSAAGDEVCIALADWVSKVLAAPESDIAAEIAIFKGGD